MNVTTYSAIIARVGKSLLNSQGNTLTYHDDAGKYELRYTDPAAGTKRTITARFHDAGSAGGTKLSCSALIGRGAYRFPCIFTGAFESTSERPGFYRNMAEG